MTKPPPIAIDHTHLKEPTAETPPPVDDEVVLTIRVRVATPGIRDQVASGLYRLLPAFEEWIRPLLYLGSGDSSIVGIEVALPGFKPYAHREVLP